MRTITALLLLTAAVLAQDAATLFYRAYWLEHAEGKPEEAEKLYEQLLRDQGEAAEAPRALLGLIRIRATRGEDVAKLLELLEGTYPKADEEIARAKALLKERSLRFDDVQRKDDTPATTLIKRLWADAMNGIEIAPPDFAFLLEAGPLAHPMLNHLLRAMNFDAVQLGARVLLQQDRPDAYAIVEAALTDESVVYKSAIVQAIAGERAPVSIVRTLARLYDGAPPSFRLEITHAMGELAAENAEIRTLAYQHLTRALKDPDPKVRKMAMGPEFENLSEFPDAYLDAALGVLEAKDEAILGDWYAWLPHFADRPGRFDRIAAILLDIGPNVAGLSRAHPKHDQGFLVMAKVVLDYIGDNPDRIRGAERLARQAARNAKAALLLAEAAVEKNYEALASVVAQTMKSSGRKAARADQLLGVENADALRRKAVACLYGEKASVGAYLLSFLLLDARHFDLVLDEVKKHPGVEIPSQAFGVIQGQDPARLIELVPYCEGGQADSLFGQATERGDLAFFRAIVPKVGPGVHKALAALAQRSDALGDIVARKVIASRDAGWFWKTPTSTHTGWNAGPQLLNSPGVRAAFARKPMFDALVDRVDDSRFELAYAAFHAAKTMKGEEARCYRYTGALASPWKDIRRSALRELGYLGPIGAKPIVEHLKREGLSQKETDAAYQALGATKDPELKAYLSTVCRSKDVNIVPWRAYLAVAPEAAVQQAIQAVYEDGNHEALRLLTEAEDRRRIDVFRKVLTRQIKGDVRLVLQTVGDQYLIELGRHCLDHLRSPEQHVRAAATATIERLKFYVEAKKSLEGG
jgi:hypothetical protein